MDGEPRLPPGVAAVEHDLVALAPPDVAALLDVGGVQLPIGVSTSLWVSATVVPALPLSRMRTTPAAFCPKSTSCFPEGARHTRAAGRRSTSPRGDLLGELIQIVMNWDDDHLHASTVGRRDYGDPSHTADSGDEDRLRLSAAFAASDTITHRYYFGGCWDHTVRCEKVLDPPWARRPPSASSAGATRPSRTGPAAPPPFRSTSRTSIDS
ncbi:hypothetical protein DQ238_11415 [Geodermatophilus sp. TF02-6]|nr:hypothetical protein DQ238_11415 [Geodermatophilus sp. TF02-6]